MKLISSFLFVFLFFNNSQLLGQVSKDSLATLSLYEIVDDRSLNDSQKLPLLAELEKEKKAYKERAINVAKYTRSQIERVKKEQLQDQRNNTKNRLDEIQNAKDKVANYQYEDDLVSKAKTEQDAERIKAELEAEKKAENIKSYNKKQAAFIDNLGGDEEETPIDDYNYDKKDFKKEIPFGAVAQGAMGLAGMLQADNELPLYEDEVSEATKAYLNESRRISKQGLPPELEAKMKNDLVNMVAVGIDNAARASGGNRGMMMANLAGVNSAQMQGNMQIAMMDLQTKEKAYAEYAKTLQHIDDFNQKKKSVNHGIKLREAQQDREQGQALATTGFSNMLNELQYQKENAPGSYAHMMRNKMEYFVTGRVTGLTKEQELDPTVRGSKAHKEAKDKREAEDNVIVRANNDLKARKKQFSKGLSGLAQQYAENNGIELESLSNDAYESQDILNERVLSQPGESRRAGYYETEAFKVDGDTAKNGAGQSFRITGPNGDNFNSIEKWDPNSSGIDPTMVMKGGEFSFNPSGQKSYTRDLGEMDIRFNGANFTWPQVAAKSDQYSILNGYPTSIENLAFGMRNMGNHNNSNFGKKYKIK